jgi:hypothetical protein
MIRLGVRIAVCRNVFPLPGIRLLPIVHDREPHALHTPQQLGALWPVTGSGHRSYRRKLFLDAPRIIWGEAGGDILNTISLTRGCGTSALGQLRGLEVPDGSSEQVHLAHDAGNLMMECYRCLGRRR